jgi:hypothetical protein
MSHELEVRDLANVSVADGFRIGDPNSGYGIVFYCSKTVPPDATVGYAPGCVCLKLDGTTSTAIYINRGTLASCDFNALGDN